MTTNEVATLTELTGLGAPLSTVHHRCRPGRPWQRILPGVILLHSGSPTIRQRMRAALAYRQAVLRSRPDVVVGARRG